MGEPTPQVTPTENGPYKVEGGIEIRNPAGEVVSAEETVFLCRCGQSQNKPFCDGTHNKVGFEGAESADRGPISERRDAYVGSEVTILDDRSVCAHVGECTDRLPQVWRQGTEPWIDADGASAEAIVEVIHRCPSGALAQGGPDETTVEPELEPAIMASKDGPYHVRGGIPVRSPGGEGYEVRNRQALCRCGHSKNKPFCDGSHWDAGFKDG